jgi:hypothetical protein
MMHPPLEQPESDRQRERGTQAQQKPCHVKERPFLLFFRHLNLGRQKSASALNTAITIPQAACSLVIGSPFQGSKFSRPAGASMQVSICLLHGGLPRLASNRHVFICDTAPIKMNEPFWLCCYAGITYHVALLDYFTHAQPSPTFR